MIRRDMILGLPWCGGWWSAFSAEPVLSAAGASFPEPIYQKWFASFATRFPGQEISYRAVGSGEGVDMLRKGAIDFAASDHPLSAAESAAMPVPVRHVPTVVGGIVPLYRLDGVAQTVRFTPDILAGIYLGRVRRWNDPALRAVNHGVALPAQEISIVRRSDRSGSTFIWTEYLSDVSPEWKAAVGLADQVKWPVEGPSAQGSKNLIETVASTPNSLGYIEFIYALDHRVGIGEVRNRSGKFVRADLTTLAAAAATAAVDGFSDAGGMHVSITDAPGDGVYPIAAFTYLLVPQQLKDPGKNATMRELLRWILTSGQKQCASLGYAALPPGVAARVLQQAGLA
jgi:phosphate transport system substrate-binding protein